ncbi:MAG: prolipoprotein diacylglyceryl transferase [Bacillota bacterium]|nr:prolipoprotein diacylglyceryl transferase [Bacillota bacterium]
MSLIQVRPVLFSLGRWKVYSYGTALALSFLLGTWLVVRQVRRRGEPVEWVYDLALLVAVSAVAGARLLFVLLNWGDYAAHPAEIWHLTAGGLSMHGGFAAAFLAGLWFTRRRRLNPWAVADLAAPPAALGTAVTRVGCFLNGCCYGLPAPPPWGMDACYLHDTLRYPVQLYESGLAFLLFLGLWRNREHRHFPGYLMFSFAGWYSVIRFAVEFLRDGPRLWPPLTLAQVASLAIAAVAFALMLLLDRRWAHSAAARGEGRGQ